MRETNKEYILPYRQNDGGISDNQYIGNPRTVDRPAQIRGRNGRNVMDYSFRKVAAIGMGIRIGRQANEVVGTYTGRRLRQKQNQSAIDFATRAFAITQFGPIGVVYAGTSYAYEYFNHSMSVAEEQLKAENARIKSRNNTTSMSRHSGGKV